MHLARPGKQQWWLQTSSLKEEQRTALKAFLDRKDVFALLPTGFGKSLIYQLAPQVIWFVNLIGRSQSVLDGDREMVYPITFKVFFLNFTKRLPIEPSWLIVCNKPSGTVRLKAPSSWNYYFLIQQFRSQVKPSVLWNRGFNFQWSDKYPPCRRVWQQNKYFLGDQFRGTFLALPGVGSSWHFNVATRSTTLFWYQ